MRKLILVLIILLSYNSYGQKLHPAKWTFTVEEKKTGEAELVFHIKLDPEWHVYSQYTPDGGPLPMLFTFDSSDCFTRVGKVSEPKPIEEYDSLFAIKVLFLTREAELRQKVTYKGSSCRITGKIEYQVCKEACIFQDTTFTLNTGRSKSEGMLIPSGKPKESSVPIQKIINNSADAMENNPEHNLIISKH